MYSIPRHNLQISKPPKLPAAKATQPIIGDSKHPESVRARIMSLDAVMPFVDDERGARTRLEQLHEVTCAHYEKMLQEWRDRAEEGEEIK